MLYNSIVNKIYVKRGDNMQEKMEQIYNNLSEENKDILNMVAKGMQIAQENGGTQNAKININITK